MSPMGDRAVTATDEHRVQFWELPSGRLLHDQAVRYPFHVGRARRSTVCFMGFCQPLPTRSSMA